MQKGSVEQSVYLCCVLFFLCCRSGCTTIHTWKTEPHPRRTGSSIVILCLAEWAAFTEVFTNLDLQSKSKSLTFKLLIVISKLGFEKNLVTEE